MNDIFNKIVFDVKFNGFGPGLSFAIMADYLVMGNTVNPGRKF